MLLRHAAHPLQDLAKRSSSRALGKEAPAPMCRRGRGFLRLERLLGLALLWTLVSCGGSTEKLAPSFRLVGDDVERDPSGTARQLIDFGTVAVGMSVASEALVVNDGTASLEARLSDVPSFGSVAPRSLTVPKKESRPIVFSVRPMEAGSFEAILRFRTNDGDPNHTVRLIGQAVQSSLECEPMTVDFGGVPRGERRVVSVDCKNPLQAATTVRAGKFSGAHGGHFGIEIDGVPLDEAEIAPGGTLSFDLSFEAGPTLSGTIASTLPLHDPRGAAIGTLSLEAFVLETSLLILHENEGDIVPLVGCDVFRPTDIGEKRERSLFLRNEGREPVRIQEIHFQQEGGPFTVGALPPLPHLLDPSEELKIPITFAPGETGRLEASLRIVSDDPLEPASGLSACVRGSGGDALLVCSPSSLDFGLAALGMTIERSYECANNGTDILFVTGSETTEDEAFTAEIRNPDGSTGPRANGYGVGEGFSVQVSFRPGVEKFFSAKALISNSSTKGTHETTLIGIGRDLPPCVFDKRPDPLRFGVVALGQKRILSSYLTNHLETDCIVANLSLDPGSDRSFEMESLSSAVIPGRDRLPITVQFAPTDFGTHSGKVTFTISDGTDGTHTLDLVGIAKDPCIEVDPPYIDFGSASPSCATRERPLAIFNSCGKTVEIRDISIDDVYEGFSLTSLPHLPRKLEAGQRLEIAADFRPEREVRHFGAILIEAREDGAEGQDVGPITVPLEGRGDIVTVQTDSHIQPDNPKLDLLIVNDNSVTIESYRAIVVEYLPELMDFGFTHGIDFHVGVTTTGLAEHGHTGCPGGFNGREDGRLFPHPSLGKPRILTSAMSRKEFVESLEYNLDAGACAAQEPVYEAARRALSHPWIDTPEAEGGNQGFLRRDAALSILGITDEEDTDSFWMGDPTEDRSVSRYVSFFQRLKPSWKAHTVKIHFLSGGKEDCPGHWQPVMPCVRCVEGTELTKGVHLSGCDPIDDPRWPGRFKQLSAGAFGRDVSFPLRALPKDMNGDEVIGEDDLRVDVDGRVVTEFNDSDVRVWWYDPASNSIVFGSPFVPSQGQLIQLTYTVNCAGN